MKAKLCLVLMGITISALLPSCSKNLPEQVIEYAFTCSRCGSTMMSPSEKPMFIDRINIIYTNSASSRCRHRWVSGITSVYPRPLSDGALVLVKQGNIYGAFILKEQSITPEAVVYQWWYRKDGKGKFAGREPEIVSGVSEYDVKKNPRTKIAFGPFYVGWSGSAKGTGCIYYHCNPGGRPSPSTTLICVTDKTCIEEIDAADPKWHYGASPSDYHAVEQPIQPAALLRGG